MKIFKEFKWKIFKTKLNDLIDINLRLSYKYFSFILKHCVKKSKGSVAKNGSTIIRKVLKQD